MVTTDVWSHADELDTARSEAFNAVERAIRDGGAEAEVERLVARFREQERAYNVEIDRLLK